MDDKEQNPSALAANISHQAKEWRVPVLQEYKTIRNQFLFNHFFYLRNLLGWSLTISSC